ncbi:phosphoadenosine phosphosulfate reductase family protein [Marinobacter alkaliphilus]|uniref:Phosphoadenosine phosphosulfate reductase family protein n=1 Tax=Marinobacter alkaliphilus TaxID=254719 RepID=A0ABZ3EAK8_9GAMM
MNDLFAPQGNLLTVLSFGAGQDSSALLEMYLDDPKFRQQYAPNDFVVVMADTGDEFDQTYDHVRDVQRRCKAAGVEFVLISPEMGFHSESWRSLRHFYRSKGTIGSKAFPKTCTDRLKIQPIYRWLEHWLSEKYGVQCNRKAGIREFAARYGRIKMMIGIAKGEETRMADPAKNPNRWYRESIEPVYPLVDMGMDRAACQKLLHAKGLYVIPSNCKACPFLSEPELEYLRRFYPEALADWVELEAAKLKKHADKSAVIVTDKEGNPKRDREGRVKVENRNYGVFGVTPLPAKIRQAKETYESWSDEDIIAYRYSHGHCVSTAY